MQNMTTLSVYYLFGRLNIEPFYCQSSLYIQILNIVPCRTALCVYNEFVSGSGLTFNFKHFMNSSMHSVREH